MKNDGGPAFPVDEIFTSTPSGGAESWRTCVGMSLRDWFAGQALTNPDNTVAQCYEFADAMLKERVKE